MSDEFQYSVEDGKKFGVLLVGAKDLIRGYHKSMSKGKINDELKKRDTDDRERIYWEERAPKLLDDLEHKFRDTFWVDWVKNKHPNWYSDLLKDSELVDYVPALKELKSLIKGEEKATKAAAPPNAKKIKKKTKPIMRNYAIIAVAVLLLASVPWFLAVQSLQNNNNDLESSNNDLANDIDIRVQEISGLNARVSSLNSVNDDREKKNAVLQSDLSSKDREVEQLKNQFINLQNELNLIACKDCVPEFNYGRSSAIPYYYWELTSWNEFNGYIRGEYHSEFTYTVCIWIETDPKDEFGDLRLIAKAETDESGEWNTSWTVGNTYYDGSDFNHVTKYIASLIPDDENIVVVDIIVNLCDGITYRQENYSIHRDDFSLSWSNWIPFYIDLSEIAGV